MIRNNIREEVKEKLVGFHISLILSINYDFSVFKYMSLKCNNIKLNK